MYFSVLLHAFVYVKHACLCVYSTVILLLTFAFELQTFPLLPLIFILSLLRLSVCLSHVHMQGGSGVGGMCEEMWSCRYQNQYSVSPLKMFHNY